MNNELLNGTPRAYLPPSFEAVEQQSKFEIQGTLGSGGMGTIYDAYDKNIRRKVAIKCINNERAQDDISRKYFAKEAQITGQLEHPNIIPVYEMGLNPQGLFYYVMKRVQGNNLADILDEIRAGNAEFVEKFPIGTLMSIYRKILDAISYAHSRGVVHLDLKPENVMVGDYGEVLILDWGIARLRKKSPNAKSDLFVTLDEHVDIAEELEKEQVIGTPAFMAPEQATGQSLAIGTRTDIYSLGAILYNILTLRPPAAGKTTTVIIKKIVTGRVRDPMSYNKENNLPEDKQVKLSHIANGKIPERLSKIAMMAMSERLDDRYQNVAELQKDIDAYFSGHVIKADSSSISKKSSLYFNRNKYLLIIILLMMVINITLLLLAIL